LEVQLIAPVILKREKKRWARPEFSWREFDRRRSMGEYLDPGLRERRDH
jgi:hypothetical protein